jgi:RNA polymerase sigma factor (TIGR02999 family)
VYDELRNLAAARMAGESPDHTLQPTALVHEAYLRLVDVNKPQQWNSRGHFFAAAAEAMRRILVERARCKKSLKRGGDRQRLPLDDVQTTVLADEELLALDDALSALAARDPVKAELVKLRYFAGCTFEEAARVLGISVASAERYWAYARAWLHQAITAGAAP